MLYDIIQCDVCSAVSLPYTIAPPSPPLPGVILADLLSFSANIALVTRSKNMRRIEPFLTDKEAQGLIYTLVKFSHTSTLLCSLDWLSVAAHIQFLTLVLTSRLWSSLTPLPVRCLGEPARPTA